MGKRKSKVQTMDAGRFFVLWLLLTVVMQILSSLVFDTLGPRLFTRLPFLVVYLVLSIPLWAMYAWGQVYLLKRLFRRSIKGWIPLTIAALSLGIVISLSMPTLQTSLPIDLNFPLQRMIHNAPFILFPALVQWLLLRRYMHRAWLWLVGAVGNVALYFAYSVITHVFQIPFIGTPSSPIFSAVLAALTGFIALLMVFLARRDDNTMQDSDIDEDDDTDYERLADGVSDPQVEEAPLVQRRAQTY